MPAAGAAAAAGGTGARSSTKINLLTHHTNGRSRDGVPPLTTFSVAETFADYVTGFLLGLLAVFVTLFVVIYTLQGFGFKGAEKLANPLDVARKFVIRFTETVIEKSAHSIFEDQYSIPGHFALWAVHALILLVVCTLRLAWDLLWNSQLLVIVFVLALIFFLIQNAGVGLVAFLQTCFDVLQAVYGVVCLDLMNNVFKLSNAALVAPFNVVGYNTYVLGYLVYQDFIRNLEGGPLNLNFDMRLSVLTSDFPDFDVQVGGRRVLNDQALDTTLEVVEVISKQVGLMLDIPLFAVAFTAQLYLLILAPVASLLPNIFQTVGPILSCSLAKPECVPGEALYIVATTVVDGGILSGLDAVANAFSFIPGAPTVHIAKLDFTSLLCSTDQLVGISCSCSVLFTNVQQCDDVTYTCVGPDSNGLYQEQQMVNGVAVGTGGVQSTNQAQACPHSASGRRLSL